MPFCFAESMESFPSSRERARLHRSLAFRWVQIPIDVKNPNTPEGVLGFLKVVTYFNTKRTRL